MNRRQWFKTSGGAAVASLALGSRALWASPNPAPPDLADLVRLSANENPYYTSA